MAKYDSLVAVNINSVEAGAADVAGAALVLTPGAGKKIRVHSYMLQLSGAAILQFRTAAAGAGSPVGRAIQAGSAGQGGSEGEARPDFVFELAENTPLFLRLSAAATVTGGITYSIVKTTEQ